MVSSPKVQATADRDPGSTAIREDRWLAERLGRPAFTVRGASDTELRTHFGSVEPAFYQARVAVPDDDRLAALEALGLRRVSETLTLAREPGSDAGAAAAAHEIREADPGRDVALGEIAARAFTSSRFHLDPQIPAGVAARIKRDWALNCLRGERGDGMLVAAERDAPVGFLAFASGSHDGRPARVIDLIAVDPAHAGTGIGTALVERLIGAGASEPLVVGTQRANDGATRFYERLGFRLAGSAHDLHLHLPEGGRERAGRC